ncbi:glycosyltransferase family 1 protein [Yimella radicis]
MTAQRPRILFVGMTHNPGGKESYILSAFEAIRDHYDCWFLADRPRLAHEEALLAKGATIARVRPRGSSPMGYYRDIRQLFVREQFDVVWCHQSVLNTLAPLSAAKRSKTPTRIIHSHSTQNLGTWVAGVLHPILRHRLPAVANTFFACSSAAGRWLFAEHPFVVMPNSFDTGRFSFDPNMRIGVRSNLNISGSAFAMIHVARFGTEKNHSLAVSVLAEMAKSRPDAVAIFVGDGPLRPAVEEQARCLGLTENVRFLGLRDDVPALLQAADVAILPSTFEGLPYSILEAQAAGLPCVVSTGVPTEVDLTGNVDFLTLNSPIREWAETILQAPTKAPRLAGATPLSKTPYDNRHNSAALLEAINSPDLQA